jgi:hypothetical protein
VLFPLSWVQRSLQCHGGDSSLYCCAGDALQGAPLPFHPAHRGGLRWPLYCCTSAPALSLLPSNIEACALLKASFRRAPAAIFPCRRPTCFCRAPAAIFSCRRPTTPLTPCSHCNLFQPNASATFTPLPSFDAAMLLLFKSCRHSCNFFATAALCCNL